MASSRLNKYVVDAADAFQSDAAAAAAPVQIAAAASSSSAAAATASSAAAATSTTTGKNSASFYPVFSPLPESNNRNTDPGGPLLPSQQTGLNCLEIERDVNFHYRHSNQIDAPTRVEKEEEENDDNDDDIVDEEFDLEFQVRVFLLFLNC